MVRLIFIFALLALGPWVYAQTPSITVNASWVHPTSYNDGSSLAPTEVQQTRIEYGTCGLPLNVATANGMQTVPVFGSHQGDLIAVGGKTTLSATLPQATYCFRAYTTAGGAEGPASNTATNAATSSQPSPLQKLPNAPTLQVN